MSKGNINGKITLNNNINNKIGNMINNVHDVSKSVNIRDSIPGRIEFIKEMLKGKKLNPLIDFERTDTEYFLPRGRDENESCESYDTRIVLKKKIYDFSNIISQIGGKLKYIKSGTTGHTFKGETADKSGTFEYAVKVVAYPKKEGYGGITDTRRPENAELVMIKLLSYFIMTKETPHIVLPIGTFDTDIKVFLNLIETDVVASDNEKYLDFVTEYQNGKFYDTASILISEWANRGDLLDFIRKHFEYLTAVHWKTFFFQILSVLAVIQAKYPTFRHNDLKANNILVHKIDDRDPGQRFKYYIVPDTYSVPSTGYIIKIWDFDFACIPGLVDNQKVEADWTGRINIDPVQNQYYDTHYFFNTLIKKGFCSDIMTSDKVPQEVKDFINRVVPKKYQKCGTKYVHKKGRILVTDEYTTPAKLLKYDPYFDEFRVKPNAVSIQRNEKVTEKSLTRMVQKKSSGVPDLSKFLRDDSDEDNGKKIGGSKTNKQKDNKKSSYNKVSRRNMFENLNSTENTKAKSKDKKKSSHKKVNRRNIFESSESTENTKEKSKNATRKEPPRYEPREMTKIMGGSIPKQTSKKKKITRESSSSSTKNKPQIAKIVKGMIKSKQQRRSQTITSDDNKTRNTKNKKNVRHINKMQESSDISFSSRD